MHEFAAVKNIVNIIMNVANKNNAKKIFSIDIGVGELTMLEKDQINYWLKLLLEDIEIAESSNINLYTIKGVIECKDCNYNGKLSSTLGLDHLYPVVKCPICKSDKIEIVKGDRCIVEKIEIEKDNIEDDRRQ